MKKTILRMTAAVVLTLGAVTLATAQTPIPIGFLATMSGPLGVIGQDQYNAFMLAVEQRGGKLGGFPVEILKEDDQFKPEVATQLTQKLIERQVKIITGISGSNIMMAVAKPIAEKQIFLVSTNPGPSPLAGAGCSPYQFIVGQQVDTMAEAVGQYATDKGYKKIFMLAPNFQAGKDMLSGFKRFYKGGSVVAEMYTPLSQLDFSSEITQIAAAKPDAVFVFYPGGLGVNFVRQYQQAGLLAKLPLLSTGTIDGTSIPGMKELALGALTGSTWAPDTDNASNRQFVEAFEAKYKTIPSFLAAMAYDGALLLDSAIAKVKGNIDDKKAFAAALKAADFKSVRGTFRFDNNNFPIQDMLLLEAAKDAKGRISLKTVATPLPKHQDAYHALCAMK